MVLNAKLRRHSGRVTPGCFGLKKEILIEEGIEPQVYWDDWVDYRDGSRGSNDRKMLRNEHMFCASYFYVRKWNKKLRKLIFRRKAKREKAKDLYRNKINLIYDN